ncbi:hypothetical protein HDA43_005797 [Streptosporangium sandarakinum]|uniref:Uncharacterized protein n=1 Tax=Streptosporangium sandarakinum TaxID=1260955 RepID=A0A852V648_9ACTN|nr:hypothetical protein [Streptosporangium sandarakinum]
MAREDRPSARLSASVGLQSMRKCQVQFSMSREQEAAAFF